MDGGIGALYMFEWVHACVLADPCMRVPITKASQRFEWRARARMVDGGCMCG
ncbi:hypothetical protein QJS04_geneDACA012875 [Acorus gramineus]|uniref:Uncharacterized protein n=1 Tax=Acorus gramineus TaxID=55184 RepID=A0AAV9BHE7_ACOGR|nr:hypothetical protein QJS04_geneDACA012875 [Acorus gramineus]